ncbi:hypothetical protein QUB68_29585 [Microcoleus sp. A006_D1]|uniref:hypothetical protein n=1 Tax=Microcoleus sp. A006_D1 TaxID=3055267 RepID=UPI002FD02F48
MRIESVRSTLDPASHPECLEFIRVAIAEADRPTAHQVAAILKDCCERGYTDRAAIWQSLTPDEQIAFTALLR